MERGQGQGRSRRDSTFRVVHSSFLSELCRCRSSRVVQRLVCLATDPEMMEQHGKLACDGDDGPSLSSLASTLSQLQSPSAQIGVLTKWAQDVLCPLYQHHAQIGVTLSGDMQLRFTLPGVPSGRLQPNETSSITALSKSPRIFQRQHVCQRDQRPHALYLFEQRRFRIALFGQRFSIWASYSRIRAVIAASALNKGASATCSGGLSASLVARLKPFGLRPRIRSPKDFVSPRAVQTSAVRARTSAYRARMTDRSACACALRC
jgi:hypothetical protein